MFAGSPPPLLWLLRETGSERAIEWQRERERERGGGCRGSAVAEEAARKEGGRLRRLKRWFAFVAESERKRAKMREKRGGE